MSRRRFVLVEVIKENPFVTFVTVILVAAIIFGIGSCSEQSEKQSISQSKNVTLTELAILSGNGRETISTKDEEAWLSANAPQISFNSLGRMCVVHTGRQPYDGSHRFASQVDSYLVDPFLRSNSQNTAAYIKRHLNSQYKTLHATLMLEKEDVEKWLSRQQEVNLPDIQGSCYIFADDQLIYQSPVLTPNNASLSIDVDVTGVRELVIVVVGAAHLTDAYLTR